MEWISTFLDIGESFSETSARDLREYLVPLCNRYFNNYHNKTWNDLTEILRDERWTKLPLPGEFSIEKMVSKSLDSLGPALNQLVEKQPEPYFQFEDLAFENPFENQEERIPDDPQAALVDSRDKQKQGPIMWNSGLWFSKSILGYITLLPALTPIGFEIFHAITTLIEFFIYSIFWQFWTENGKDDLFVDRVIKDITVQHEVFLYQSRFWKVKNSIVRIKDFIESINIGSKHNFDTIVPKTMNWEATNLFNIAESKIAMRSLKIIQDILLQSREYICSILEPAQHNYINMFLDNTVVWISQMEDFLLQCLLPHMVKLDWLKQTIMSQRWETLQQAPGLYVDRLYQLIRDLKVKLGHLERWGLTEEMQSDVLARAIEYTYKYLITCYSLCRRYTANGRVQASYDLSNLQGKFIQLLDNHLSCNNYIEYIELWHKPADSIVKWALEHTELPLGLHAQLFMSSPAYAALNKTQKENFLFTLDNHYSNVMKENDFN